ncbi:hypothetical protein HYH02_006992 [Chlamydomonas schloesseri]|uniref:Sulfhydryl oxidase n=1 Tax=Chlamydomonas schloesseri TaxID=2026947 RepID=A0A835WIJ7_9CHLO|nr:hypothetical protein HYH02_006992 [Chlamydomonas schloesseri]|eukprot:KAG2447963.1 hypothetical protein HYH02_006992 [Chlamydomonas schloesseri]
MSALIDFLMGGRRPAIQASRMRFPGEEEEPAAVPQRPSPKPTSRLPAHLQLNPPQAPRNPPAAASHSANAVPAVATPAGLSASASQVVDSSVSTLGAQPAAASLPAASAAAAPATATAAAPDTTPGSRSNKLSDCKSRACSGVLKAFKRALHEEGQMPAPGPQPASAASSSPPASSASSDLHPPPAATIAAAVGTAMGAAACAAEGGGGGGGAAAAPPPPLAAPCPPDTWELGRATWTFLHSVAAAYPAAPSGRQQALMRGLVEGLAEFYPCEVCREHLREQVAARPPAVESGPAFSLWLCGLHNEVNEMLGKPQFDCSRLGERWREGPADGSCD